MSDQPERKQINFTIVPDEQPGEPRTYANFCSIAHTPFDFTLTFCEVMPLSEKEVRDAERPARRQGAGTRTRVVVPVQFLPNLVAALAGAHARVLGNLLERRLDEGTGALKSAGESTRRDHRDAGRAAPERRHGAALSQRVRAAGGDDPLGAIHRCAREHRHAGAVRALPRCAGAGQARAGVARAADLSTGFFRQKSKALIGMAQTLVAEHSGEVPADMEQAHGAAGRRAARRRTSCSATRSACQGFPLIATCCASSNRIGIAEGDDPVKVEAQLCRGAPERDVDARVGRRRSCTAVASAGRNRCAIACAVAEDCDYYRADHWPIEVTPHDRAKFERLVAEAITLIPKRFRREMRNWRWSSRTSRAPTCSRKWTSSRRIPCTASIRARPCRSAAGDFGNALPDRITLYQRPIEEDCDDEDEVRAVIGETLIHEVGHYFGLSEEEIEEIEERYWRGGDACGASRTEDCSSLRPALSGKRASASASTSSSRRGLRSSSPRSPRHPDDTFLEIGPGRGALTLALAGARQARRRRGNRPRPRRCTALTRAPERARRPGRLPRRRSRRPAARYERQPVRVVGNLPYNVASPILFRLLHDRREGRRFRDATLMLQKEVADRLVRQARLDGLRRARDPGGVARRRRPAPDAAARGVPAPLRR